MLDGPTWATFLSFEKLSKGSGPILHPDPHGRRPRVTSAKCTEGKLGALCTGFNELETIFQAQTAQELAEEVHAVASKPSRLPSSKPRISPSDSPSPNIPPDEPLTCTEIVIVDLPSKGRDRTLVTVRHEPPVPSLLLIVLGWATLLPSAFLRL